MRVSFLNIQVEDCHLIIKQPFVGPADRKPSQQIIEPVQAKRLLCPCLIHILLHHCNQFILVSWIYSFATIYWPPHRAKRPYILSVLSMLSTCFEQGVYRKGKACSEHHPLRSVSAMVCNNLQLSAVVLAVCKYLGSVKLSLKSVVL